MSKKDFPDFFYSKEAVVAKTVPLLFNEDVYWMLNVKKNQDDVNENQSLETYYLPPYADNDDGMIECGEVEETFEIVQMKSGKFVTSFHVASALQSVIIGTRGIVLRSLEAKTNTQIKVPRINQKGDVKIMGNSERAVSSARNQIAMLILNKREKLPVSHFISIPMMSEEIKINYKIFQEQILNGPKTRGVDNSIFQKSEKLHLTITTLTLLDDLEVEEIKRILKHCYQDVVKSIFSFNEKCTIILQGVEIMNDDPSDVNVLYGKVKLKTNKESEQFQQICNEIVIYLYKKGFIKKQYDQVKLHVTLMNSLFRQKSDDYERTSNHYNRERESFDASHILDKFNDYYFGQTTLENIHLSIRFSSGCDGYYESALTLP